MLLLITTNPYPQSSVLTGVGAVTARHYRNVSHIHSYFHLRSQNDELMHENALLRQELEALSDYKDEGFAASQLGRAMRSTRIVPARVIESDYRLSHNILTIDRGLMDGVTPGQGVRSADGVVGVVASASNHYAWVMPIVHTSSRLSCTFLKSGYTCTLTWDGRSDRYAQLEDVALHVPVEIGDTIVTSGLTQAYTRDIPVGIVSACDHKPGDSYYTIRIRLATDFRSLRYVQVINQQR